jgi:hypothetical protein
MDNIGQEAPGLGDLSSDFDFEQSPRAPLLLPTHPEPGPASEPPGSTPPTVETQPASSIGATSAQPNATVNPHGQPVSDCRFEYGPSPSYGASTPCASLPGSGSTPVGVSAILSNLSADSIYHLRIVASNRGGTSWGADATFTTLPGPPVLSDVAPQAGE